MQNDDAQFGEKTGQGKTPPSAPWMPPSSMPTLHEDQQQGQPIIQAGQQKQRLATVNDGNFYNVPPSQNTQEPFRQGMGVYPPPGISPSVDSTRPSFVAPGGQKHPWSMSSTPMTSHSTFGQPGGTAPTAPPIWPNAQASQLPHGNPSLQGILSRPPSNQPPGGHQLGGVPGQLPGYGSQGSSDGRYPLPVFQTVHGQDPMPVPVVGNAALSAHPASHTQLRPQVRPMGSHQQGTMSNLGTGGHGLPGQQYPNFQHQMDVHKQEHVAMSLGGNNPMTHQSTTTGVTQPFQTHSAGQSVFGSALGQGTGLSSHGNPASQYSHPVQPTNMFGSTPSTVQSQSGKQEDPKVKVESQTLFGGEHKQSGQEDEKPPPPPEGYPKRHKQREGEPPAGSVQEQIPAAFQNRFQKKEDAGKPAMM